MLGLPGYLSNNLKSLSLNSYLAFIFAMLMKSSKMVANLARFAMLLKFLVT